MIVVGRGSGRWIAASLALSASSAVGAQTPPQITIGQLLADGWEIAGYASAQATLGSLILFKHKDRNYFVQCSVVYDATRSQRAAERVVINCYEIR